MSTHRTYRGELTGKPIVVPTAAPELGRGGMGVVVLGEYDGAPAAMKILRAEDSTPARKNRLIENIRLGSPHRCLTWSKEVGTDAAGRLVIVMKVLASHLVQAAQITDPNALPEDGVNVMLRTLTRICYHLADIMAAVQGRGYCYGDPSTNQFHCDLATGQVEGCDTDNAFIDDGKTISHLGTPFFMTPRLGLGKERVTRSTDAFAVGVCLFNLQTFSFPLLGKRKHEIGCLGAADWNRLLHVDPVFVFDPVLKVNRPVPGIDDPLLKGWARLPLRTRRLFTELFTKGLYNVAGRINVAVWREEFKRLHDAIAPCPYCGAEFYYDYSDPSQRCWNCGEIVPRFPRLEFKDTAVVLAHGTELYRHHARGLATADFEPAGRLICDKSKPARWGLKNVSPDAWYARIRRNGVDQTVVVRPGEAACITKHMKLFFPGGVAAVQA